MQRDSSQSIKLILFVLIITFAAFLQGIVGFGQVLMASPLSLTILSNGIVLSTLVNAGLALNATLLNKAKEPLDTKIFKPLLAGSIIGVINWDIAILLIIF